MKRTTFGRTGLQVSMLGFGAAPIGFLQTDPDRTSRLLNGLLDAGINVIDTAATYAGSEEMIARAIGRRREEFVLVSKCGQAVEGVSGASWSAEVVRQTIDRALRRLQTDRLDVMLLHSCDLETLKKGEAAGALVEAQKAGKIRWAGYSGDNQAAAWAAQRPEFAVIETSVNIADQANIEMVLPVARKHDAGVLVKRSIANAAWRQPTQQPGFYADYASTYHDRLKKMGIAPGDFGIAGPLDEAWPELALRFTLSQAVHCAIIGTTNPDRIAMNVRIAERGPLPADVAKRLRAAFDAAEAASSTMWMGQT